MRLPIPRRRLALLALLPAAARAQTPPGPWQGTWEVVREDPRSRGAALPLLRLQVTHEEEADTAEIRWVAQAAICHDPHAPCRGAGAMGRAREVVVDERQLSCLLDIPGEAANPYRLVLTRGESPWFMGRLFPGGGELSLLVAARPRPD